MKVNIVLLNELAKVPFKEHQKDFCYDCVATSCEEVAPNVYKYGLGIALQIDRDKSDEMMKDGYICSFRINPRSSIWKTGMALSNSVGIVDDEYTGEISAVYYHVIKELPIYEVGNKICQLQLDSTEPIQFNIVDHLEKTDRGDGGYGSTGK